MHNQICFTVDGQEICIPIPVLLAINPIPIPDPDPGPIRELIDHWVEVSGPTPDPGRPISRSSPPSPRWQSSRRTGRSRRP